jgi:hypothetical protein
MRFEAGDSTMQEAARPQASFQRFNEAERDVQLKQALDSLESENVRLKELVVRLSETIIRNVVTKR